ncbi:MAG: response regulator, partial [Candidatus Latescibacteria bacterium]|nr:response regulator [Candidatus Latescibacterota bacterium]
QPGALRQRVASHTAPPKEGLDQRADRGRLRCTTSVIFSRTCLKVLDRLRLQFQILLTEDNPVNQRLAVRLLERWGHRVTVAENGRQALSLLEDQKFDLALMDVQMPEMDGFETTARIREREKATGAHLPIIAMTAYAMEGDRERCMAAGMDGYVAKPILAEDLFQTIEQVVLGKDGAEVAPATLKTDSVFDREEALERVGGDADLLGELTELLLDNCPGMLARLEEAVSRRDAKALERAAHTLKGAVGQLGARNVSEAALRLETIGAKNDLTGAKEILAVLEKEMERFRAAVLAFRDENTP